MSGQGFICQVDHLACRKGALFGYGWALFETVNILDGSLLLKFESGRTMSVRIDVNRERKDVSAIYPRIPHAGNSGFMFLAGWRGDDPISGQLQFTTSLGNTFDSNLNFLAEFPNRPFRRFDGWKSYMQRGWRHLRKGNFRELADKARRLQSIGIFSRQSDSKELLKLMGFRPARLIIDHNMGGGANLFRDRQIRNWLASSTDAVIVLTFNLHQMGYLIEIHTQTNSHRLKVSDFQAINRFLSKLQFREVFVNCLVSFPDLSFLEEALYEWVIFNNAHLIVAIHEYFTICPSHFLLDSDGKYCGIPSDLKVCQQCLSEHRDGFVSLVGERSIAAWRRIWGKLLMKADEVRCFSASSLKLIQVAYPELKHQLTLIPHHVDRLRVPQLPVRSEGDPLCLGVVGSINEHKGAYVLDSLSRAIGESGLLVVIVVVGTINANISPHGVIQTGPYQTKDLPDLFERHGIHLALMPSICPETFSFVTHELISMQVPVACFSLGAQEEAVSNYSGGHILSASDGPGMLAELIKFADKLATR